MSEAKFTKGQWRHTNSASGRHQISGESGKQICAMWNCKERDANAALIAAAPEMYEMLEKLSMQLTCINAHKAVDEIERLLKKARGES